MGIHKSGGEYTAEAIDTGRIVVFERIKAQDSSLCVGHYDMILQGRSGHRKDKVC